ncbi:MAG: hypothetical protein H6741_17540 [Alphaproteobacteria bacterium]|nr:hypothetical protein [Alphaproteobacteria bacterium]MCB9794522.1 hypothetical protein [Alphaproteobacteria bacterium]
MATIRIRCGEVEQQRPLATSTLIGRHLACTWTIESRQVPLYWLELRWVRGWAWRALTAQDQTRGPGRPLPGGWRRLSPGTRVHGPGEVSVLLEEGGAPEPFLLDLERGEVLRGEALDERVEQRADGLWPLGAEGRPELTRPLEDGQAFVVEGQVLRFHAGEPPAETRRCRVSLLSPACELSLAREGEGWALELSEGDAELRVEAEHVRALVPYVAARIEDVPRGGWLELDAAHQHWQELGGRSDSTRERIAQDRSRLCRTLSRLGVGAAAELFQTVRRPEGWVTRVEVEPERLHLEGAG